MFARKEAVHSLGSSTHRSSTLPPSSIGIGPQFLEKEMNSFRKINLASESIQSNVEVRTDTKVQHLDNSTMEAQEHQTNVKVGIDNQVQDLAMEAQGHQSNVEVRTDNQDHDLINSTIEAQQRHLYTNAMAWMSKNARSVYEEV